MTGGKYLDSIGRTADGSIVGQWANGSSPNQQWTVVPTGSYYKVINRANGKALDTGGQTADGARHADVVRQHEQQSAVDVRVRELIDQPDGHFRRRRQRASLAGSAATADSLRAGGVSIHPRASSRLRCRRAP